MNTIHTVLVTVYNADRKCALQYVSWLAMSPDLLPICCIKNEMKLDLDLQISRAKRPVLLHVRRKLCACQIIPQAFLHNLICSIFRWCEEGLGTKGFHTPYLTC
jgi:hypothetical protein